MTVYLLCFDRPLAHARHYLGFTESDDPTARIEHHRKGTGAKLCAAASERGIELRLVRVWVGATRKEERRIKDQHQAARYCPICSGRVTRPRVFERDGITDRVVAEPGSARPCAPSEADLVQRGAAAVFARFG